MATAVQLQLPTQYAPEISVWAFNGSLVAARATACPSCSLLTVASYVALKNTVGPMSVTSRMTPTGSDVLVCAKIGNAVHFRGFLDSTHQNSLLVLRV
ncbi:hypothetical protein ACLK1U_12020 [Escherichia coli]